MIRNLKVLGLALVAVLAMSAVAASGASATETTGELTADEPFILTGEDHVEDVELFFNEAAAEEEAGVECTDTHYLGEELTTETGAPIQPNAMEVTVTPTYDDCHFLEAFPTTVTMNGCDFELALGDTVPRGPADDYFVSSALVCHEGAGPVEVHIYLSQEAHQAEQSFCTITIEPQGGLTGATVTDEGNGHLTLGGEIGGIEQSKEGACGAEESNTGILQLGATLTGFDEPGGKEVEVSISHQEREA